MYLATFVLARNLCGLLFATLVSSLKWIMLASNGKPKSPEKALVPTHAHALRVFIYIHVSVYSLNVVWREKDFSI